MEKRVKPLEVRLRKLEDSVELRCSEDNETRVKALEVCLRRLEDSVELRCSEDNELMIAPHCCLIAVGCDPYLGIGLPGVQRLDQSTKAVEPYQIARLPVEALPLGGVGEDSRGSDGEHPAAHGEVYANAADRWESVARDTCGVEVEGIGHQHAALEGEQVAARFPIERNGDCMGVPPGQRYRFEAVERA